MSEIGALSDSSSLDPEALDVLDKAFRDVCATLGVSDKARHSREIIAKMVLELSDGQRDPEAIRAVVVASLAAQHTGPPQLAASSFHARGKP
jgi:hypothetical protein